MTYFLEKHYDLVNGKLEKANYGHIMVRPCKDDYETVLAIMKNAHPTRNEICLEGQCAMFNDVNGFGGTLEKRFGSLEEWMIWLNLEKGIFLDFEDVLIYDEHWHNTYNAKTIDLHTKEVLWDDTEKIIAEIIKGKF